MPHPDTPTILAIAAATLIGYKLIARHLRAVRQDVRRVEDLGERVVATDQAILAALRGGGTDAEDAAARMLG